MKDKQLEPKEVFDCFKEINNIPRPSKHEEKIIAFLMDFGQKLGLETKKDKTGNVLISKPASQGYEHLRPVVIQSHMDMVCEKNAEREFNFYTDSIETYVDGDWMKAKGTTLGADDGIGMAMAMAVLKSKELKHGPLECLFTRDEETGLTGAMGLEPGFMNGDFLINLDSEEEGQIFISCAGGANTEVEYPFTKEPIPENYSQFKIQVKGLTGGHSGDDIEKQRANANKLLVRFLCDQLEKTQLRLIDIQSGGLHNAIPREGYAICAVPTEYNKALKKNLESYLSDLTKEYAVTEKNLNVTIEETAGYLEAENPQEMRRMLLSLRVVHNGIYAMSQEMSTFVETSSNLASIHLENDKIKVVTSQRSSLMSNRKNMSATVRAAFELGGATKITTGDAYPGWATSPDSPLVKKAVECYQKLFNKNPQVLGIHAGLECGLFSEKYPNMDMVSFGPTLKGVHSPDEKMLIPTVKTVWDYLLEILKNIPE